MEVTVQVSVRQTGERRDLVLMDGLYRLIANKTLVSKPSLPTHLVVRVPALLSHSHSVCINVTLHASLLTQHHHMTGGSGKPVLLVESYRAINMGPYPEDRPKDNSVRFTPVQVEAIGAGVQPGESELGVGVLCCVGFQCVLSWRCVCAYSHLVPMACLRAMRLCCAILCLLLSHSPTHPLLFSHTTQGSRWLLVPPAQARPTQQCKSCRCD